MKETPDQYAERVLRDVALAFSSPIAPPFHFSKADNYTAIVSPDGKFDVKIRWRPGYEKRLPPIVSRIASKRGVFTLQQIWSLMSKAGASDNGILCSLPIIARESSFNGLADNPSSSAKGLFQGLDASYPEAVYSADLYDHLPMAKTMVKENRLSGNDPSMVNLYLGVFQPAVRVALKGATVKNFRGWFRSTRSGTTYDAQYLVKPSLAPQFTFHDTVYSAVSAFNAFTRILSLKGNCPFVLEIEVPRYYSVIGYKITKKGTPMVLSITQFPIGLLCERSNAKRHGSDTLAMMANPKHAVAHAAAQYRSMGSPILAAEVPIDMGNSQSVDEDRASRSEQFARKLPALQQKRAASIREGSSLSGFGSQVKTTYE